MFKHLICESHLGKKKTRRRRDFALDFFRRMRDRMAESGPPPRGIHIHMGVTAAQKIANMIVNLERGSIAPVEMICRRK